jgi:hypothetical protein
LVDTRDDLLGDCCGVNMFGVESVTQSRNTSCDLVELNALLASICRTIRCSASREEFMYLPRFNTYMMAMWIKVSLRGGVDDVKD